MNEEQSIQLLKCLADKSRMQLLKSLMIEDMYVELLAQRLDLSAGTVSFHLKKLEDVGAVKSYKDQYYKMYSINQEIFQQTLWNLLEEKSNQVKEQDEREEKYREKVLTAFFEYGKLKSIPAQRKKERIVLEEMIHSFEQGRDYSEKEVNLILADYFDDFCTLRQDMIGEGLLLREDGLYRRNSG